MNLFRPLWFIWGGKDGNRGGGSHLQIKIFNFFLIKNHRENGKSTGKNREFYHNWRVATLKTLYLLHKTLFVI